ncbi:MAG: Lrp/AsnC family transcriptional regulator [Candidatus Heimdallarchaeota archaeon]|nr:Lrp/AsnC family transcriptional regulator [Candidatus Heimdallarchaeota archaeon]
MPLPRNRPVSKIRNKSTFYLLVLSSGIITSFYVVLDDVVNLELIKDPFIFGAFEMVVGFVVSLLFVAFLHIPFRKKEVGKRRLNLGYLFDRNFQRLKFPRGKVGIYTLLAGIFASGSTILYFYLLKENGSAVIMPFSQFVLIYLLIGEAIADKEKPVIVEIQSIAMIAIGVIIASLSTGTGTLDLNSLLINIALIMGPFSLFSACYIFFQKKALTTKNDQGRLYDTINLRMWTMVIIMISQCIAAIPSLIRGGFTEVATNWKTALTPVIFSMLFVFIAIVFSTRALTMGKMSIVRALSSVSVIVTIPLTLIVGIWIPTISGIGGENLSTTLILKIAGSLLILVGVIALALSETRSILLAKVKQGEEIRIEELTKIKGVTDVSFITGTYDLLINVKIRSIGKLYSMTENSIAKLAWITDVTTHHIMKEYE